MLLTAYLALAAGPGFSLKFVPSGMTQKMGGYMPIRAEMSADPGASGIDPKAFKAPMIGKVNVQGKDYWFVLDEPDGAPSKLYFDSNANGRLDDDPAPKWDAQDRGGMKMYMGTAQIEVNRQLASLGVYRFDKNDPQRAQLKNTLLYYTDFGYEGSGTFGKNKYPVALAGGIDTGARIFVDRNRNGKNEGRSESISAAKPFNFGGTTYELKVVDGTFEAVKSNKTVAEIPLPPDLSLGKPVLKFDAVATDGTKISFPKTYKGKLVMLDFWATWCGPCKAELPNLTKVYEKYHDRGFEVLGISFDQENQAENLAKFTKENNMPWRQVYEGKFWETTIGTQFGVEGIPFCLLVDGDSGKIIATVDTLRGEALEKAIDAALAKRKS